MKEILHDILYPSEEFTPIPFWFFNDEPDEAKITAQLQDYAQKGVNGFVLHPRIGLPESLPYLSEDYFRTVGFIVKTAAQIHMKVVLYDEGMYPSGSAHGMVVAANPEYASKGITLVDREACRPDGVLCGKNRVLVNFPEGERKGEVIGEFPGGRLLVYTFTGGNIRGIHFGEDDGEQGAPASADILNPQAVDAFIRLTHDRYYEHLKEYFGSTVIAFFTDEPNALGRNAGDFREWVPGLERELLEAGGSIQELEGLFAGQKNKTTELYHKLIKKYLRETFYGRLSQWCSAHGVALMGHPEASDDVEEQLYFHIPGQDLIMRRVSPESGGLTELDSVQAKLSADIARHLGRRRNANECFGVCCREGISWYFTGADMKWMIDWLGVRGVNLFVPHAFYYSVEGARKEERPPDVGPNNIWWNHYKRISDYMKRLSWLMTDVKTGARVAVLCDNNRVPYKELACLYENQIDFQYLPVSFLKDAREEKGRLCVGDCSYAAVLNVTEPAWNRLLPVQVQEPQPSKGQEAETEKVLLASRAEELLLEESLRTVLAKPLQASDLRKLRAVSLEKQRQQMYLFSNEGEEEILAEISLPQDLMSKENRCAHPKPLVCVDLWRGRAWREENGRKLSLRLPPRETLLVLQEYDGNPAEIPGVRGKEICLGDFTKAFVLQEKADNKAVYTMSYQAECVTGEEAFTVEGQEMAECFCNGELADVSLWSPHRLFIGPCLKEGGNELKMVFTGSAANLFCGAEIPFGLTAEKGEE